MKQRNEKFNFYVEASNLEKGKNETGQDVVFVDGIASTSSVADSDKETLYPSGFNLIPLLESGLVNYNHQGMKDANANVGVPVEAKIINDGKDLYVKCMLWPCPQTDGIVRAYNTFKKYNIDRSIGFSIEGKSTYKDPINTKRILKADIHGLAITFCPKNKNTLMNIIKGEYSEPFINENEEEQPFSIENLALEYNEWTSQKAGDEFYGKEGSVKEFLENNFEDHMNVLPELMEAVNKSVTVDTMRPMIPESVDHSTKVDSISTNKFGNSISKSDLYISITDKYGFIPIAEIKRVHDFTCQVSKQFFNMELITKETIEKAFSLIDDAHALIKGESSQITLFDNVDLVKGEDEDKPDEDEVEKAMGTAKCLVKAGMSEEETCDTLKKGGFEAGVATAAASKAIAALQAGKQGGDVTPMKKGEETTTLEAQPLINIEEEIKKSLLPVEETVDKISNSLEKSLSGIGTILKSVLQSNEALLESNNAMNDRIAAFEKVSQGRKSVAAGVERFANQNIQKSNQAGDIGGGENNAYNITDRNDLERLVKSLDAENDILKSKSADGKGDKWIGELVSVIEVSKHIPTAAYERLGKMGYILQRP